ncbi:Csu type fimbrial protein [Terricaulis silvestris]|uniref:Putative secreted protein n=1 Tax=Terricaulis silvestris TaxID=2686094 RepID=A0A6I6MQK1_9CAUL|nr:spore coat U domain-containing protein [Terricaulis silvestris]QGZ93832.1 putative secreted protein [Terricaulis silvestris]
MARVITILIAGAFATAVLAPMNAHAGTDTDTFTVTANVLATCEIVANDLDFGDYNPVAASNLDAATTLSLTCTNGTSYNVGLDLGEGTGASTATRYMADSGDTYFLGYTLYQNAGRTTLWGANVGSNTLAGSGTGSAATIDVYGRVPMTQTVPSGNFSDTITVTVTW